MDIKERNQTISHMGQGGVSNKELSALFNLVESSIRRIIGSRKPLPLVPTDKLLSEALCANKMYDMRFRDHMSLVQIGNAIGVSRERVRQILERMGGTGGRKVHKPFLHTFEDDDWLRAHQHLTNDKLGKLMGFSESFTRKLRGRMPYMPKRGYLKIRFAWTQIITTRLEDQGLVVEMMPFSAPYEILLNGKTRLAVKVCTKKWFATPRSITHHARFLIRKQKEKADFFICVLAVNSDNPIYFIIPSAEIRGNPQMIYIGYPAINTPKSKQPYADFKDRWDLLKSVV